MINKFKGLVLQRRDGISPKPNSGWCHWQLRLSVEVQSLIQTTLY